MKLNENTKIIGTGVILVPYKKEHVLKYHTWMLSEDLRNLTASEPLSLEEEYIMQQTWHLDENKCTFIILDKEIYSQTKDEIGAMIGDTNFFFSNENEAFSAEAEIMIAEVASQGKKRGWEAMLHMILYGIVFIHIKHFVVKIGESNSKSINMFLKMGFVTTKTVDVFNEITMERDVDSNWIEWIKCQLPIHEVLN
ncbi:N-acetyltransferase 9-like protein isoform X2 [Harmonia axyridis]|uniref:N-acetyltransferase 9-like protein isoform X2 n=1 Tax=Harmonia axyridis TaxID=115357 RepID=UPI001E2774F0|nr:N-acetyltransferase 9-like protein isoform X2 [Harmonia axyridis]